MAQHVIKRDGTKELFDAKKIRRAIELAANEAGLEPEQVTEIVDQVSETVLEFAAQKEEISTSELREKTLAELDKLEPSVAEFWRRYDQEKGR